jgi:hypothetical protein
MTISDSPGILSLPAATLVLGFNARGVAQDIHVLPELFAVLV